MYPLDPAPPSPEEYLALRAAVGWGSPSADACRRALDDTVSGVTARHEQQAVGMARLIGDRTMYLFVVDVVVHPDHQRAGLGSRMVNTLVDWARARGVRATMLVADAGLVPFYRALGFEPDPNQLLRLPRQPET